MRKPGTTSCGLAACVGFLLIASASGATNRTPFVIPSRSLATWTPARTPRPISIRHPRLAIRDGRLDDGERRIRLWGLSINAADILADPASLVARVEHWARLGLNGIRVTGLGELPGQRLSALDTLVDQAARFGLRVCLVLPPPADPFAADAAAQTDAAAQRLLERVNSLRSLRYADDPVIAMLELGDAGWRSVATDARLTGLPPGASWREQFAGWLRQRYRDTARLRAAWDGETAGTPAPSLLPAAGFAGRDRAAWHLDLHTNAHAQAYLRTRLMAPAAGRVEILHGGGADWHVQLWQAGLPLQSGAVYAVRFKARAHQPRDLAIAVMRATEPWSNLGLWQTVRPDPAWRTYHARFTATATDTNARLNIALGAATGSVEVAEFAIARDGFMGLLPDESLAPGKGPALVVAGETEARARDRRRFLAEAEARWLRERQRFIRVEMGCPILLAGAPALTPADLSARRELDLTTGASDGTVSPMCVNPGAAPIFDLVRRRLAGRPYAVLAPEAPGTAVYAAEQIPILATFAARQDWDAVWLPASVHDKPGGEGFIPAGHAIMMGGMAPLTERRLLMPLEGPRDGRGDSDWRLMLNTALGVSLDGARLTASLTGSAQPTPALSWDEGGPFTARGDGAWIWAGARNETSTSFVTLRAPDWAVIAITAMDGRPFAQSQRLLVTACGRAGRDWIEPVDASVILPPLGTGAWHVHVLAPDGRTRRRHTLAPDATLALDAADATLWRLLLRQP